MPLIKLRKHLRFEEQSGETGHYINVKEIILHEKYRQEVILFESTEQGKVLVIDESIQLTEAGESSYHEAIAHVPLFSHPNPKRVLIIGGGDGGVAARVLMHKNVTYVRQVEIDNLIVALSRKYLTSVHRNSFEDPRFKLTIEDGALYVKNTAEKFDIIIIDCSDPDTSNSPNNVLFSLDFYTDLKKCLNKGGIVVAQSGVPETQKEELKMVIGRLKKIFSYATCYLVNTPMYGGVLAIAIASDTDILKTKNEILKKRFDTSKLETDYYTPELHKAMFALPRNIQRLIE